MYDYNPLNAACVNHYESLREALVKLAITQEEMTYGEVSQDVFWYWIKDIAERRLETQK